MDMYHIIRICEHNLISFLYEINGLTLEKNLIQGHPWNHPHD